MTCGFVNSENMMLLQLLEMLVPHFISRDIKKDKRNAALFCKNHDFGETAVSVCIRCHSGQSTLVNKHTN